ncbi:MAG: hypothetical protein JKY56_05495, partial [Kofleriaceae bacterium]|nr:hypothetical protein [Kofleriaceae bacterium]
EDIQQPRLLAMAANPPDLIPGATAELTALLTAQPTSTRWSWCPLVGSSNNGYPCLVDHDLLQAEVDKALGNGQFTVPPYDLGSNVSAELSNVVPAQVWLAICSILQSGETDSPLTFSRCEESFPVTIRIDVTFGAKEITGIREVKLHYDDAAVVNTVPQLGAMTATALVNGTPISLDDMGSAELARDTSYSLEVALAEAESERYLRDPLTGDPLENAREILRLSWFHEGGELDASATSFNEGSTQFSDARANEWRTPTMDERTDDSSRLFIVIRDDRGGTSWVTSNLRFIR